MGMNDLKLIESVTKMTADSPTQRRQKLLKSIDKHVSLMTTDSRSLARNRWIHQQSDGTYQVVVMYGGKALELAKGKLAIACASAEQVIAALGIVRASVSEGKLDAQIEIAANAIRAGFSKKAR